MSYIIHTCLSNRARFYIHICQTAPKPQTRSHCPAQKTIPVPIWTQGIGISFPPSWQNVMEFFYRKFLYMDFIQKGLILAYSGSVSEVWIPGSWCVW